MLEGEKRSRVSSRSFSGDERRVPTLKEGVGSLRGPPSLPLQEVSRQFSSPTQVSSVDLNPGSCSPFPPGSGHIFDAPPDPFTCSRLRRRPQPPMGPRAPQGPAPPGRFAVPRRDTEIKNPTRGGPLVGRPPRSVHRLLWKAEEPFPVLR